MERMWRRVAQRTDFNRYRVHGPSHATGRRVKKATYDCRRREGGRRTEFDAHMGLFWLRGPAGCVWTWLSGLSHKRLLETGKDGCCSARTIVCCWCNRRDAHPLHGETCKRCMPVIVTRPNVQREAATLSYCYRYKKRQG